MSKYELGVFITICDASVSSGMEIKMISIVIEDSIFVTTNRNLISTTFYIRYNDRVFPNDRWTDFTFPILEEWKNNLVSIRNSNNIKTRLYFHDGPFWLEVEKDKNGKLRTECICDRTVRKSELTIYCEYDEFLECIYSAMKAFLKVLYKNEMQEGEFSSIYRQTVLSIKELKKILKQ